MQFLAQKKEFSHGKVPNQANSASANMRMGWAVALFQITNSPMMKKIVLISCVSQKLPHKAKAKDLYVSTLFQLNLKYANRLSPDNIFVLSAKHALLELEQEIEPYEQTLNNVRIAEVKEWANNVLHQLKTVASLEEVEFIFLAGDKYRRYLLPHIKHALVPLKGLRIGEQLQRLKELTA